MSLYHEPHTNTNANRLTVKDITITVQKVDLKKKRMSNFPFKVLVSKETATFLTNLDPFASLCGDKEFRLYQRVSNLSLPQKTDGG